MGSLGFCFLVGKRLQDNVVTVLLLPGRELWLGFDPSTRRPRHDERKCDEIVNSLRNELSAFVRIRLITPAGSNMLCTVSTVEERQACPVTEFGFCIGVVLA